MATCSSSEYLNSHWISNTGMIFIRCLAHAPTKYKTMSVYRDMYFSINLQITKANVQLMPLVKYIVSI